jgi:dihydroorotase-like cyclic amidohydrolase
MKSETHVNFMEQPILHNNALEYVVRGCIEKTEYGKHKGKITIETFIENVSNDQADFFGVYEVHNEDGSLIEHWIADFMHFDDAQLFAQIKKGHP